MTLIMYSVQESTLFSNLQNYVTLKKIIIADDATV